MTAIRPHICALMVLCLLLTSQTMAAARGANGPSGKVVLCTGTGPVTVQVDANGQPTGAVHICPECALGLFDTTSPVVSGTALPLSVMVIQGRPGTQTDVAWNGAEVRARSPPRAT